MLQTSLGLMGGVLALVATGCSSPDSPAQNYAKSACAAYQESGRVQVSTTADQASATHDLARLSGGASRVQSRKKRPPAALHSDRLLC